MKIMKLDAVALVLGTERAVSYDGERMSVECTLDEMALMMKLLESAKLKQQEPQETSTAGIAPVVTVQEPAKQARKSKPAAPAPEPEPEPAAEQDQAGAPADEPPTPGAPEGYPAMPNEVISATRVGDVLTWLYDQGYTALDDLTKACLAYRDTVTVLGRIAPDNFNERIERAAAMVLPRE